MICWKISANWFRDTCPLISLHWNNKITDYNYHWIYLESLITTWLWRSAAFQSVLFTVSRGSTIPTWRDKEINYPHMADIQAKYRMVYQKYYGSLSTGWIWNRWSDSRARCLCHGLAFSCQRESGVFFCSSFHQNRSISRFGTCPPQYCRVHEDLTHWEIIGERVINKATQHWVSTTHLPNISINGKHKHWKRLSTGELFPVDKTLGRALGWLKAQGQDLELPSKIVVSKYHDSSSAHFYFSMPFM